MIFLDTSSAIEILKGNQSLKDLITPFKNELFAITTPSIFELYHGIYKLKLLKQKISKQKYKELHDDLEHFMNHLIIFSLNEIAANFAAKLHVQLKSSGQEIDVFDCLIAAIIITHNYKKIITQNKKHFERIKQLEVLAF
jgi:predicted nucleic acid-binding protein